MRTTIVIDDELMDRAMEATGVATKREVVEMGLQALVRAREQRKMLGLFGKVEWEGDIDEMRRNA